MTERSRASLPAPRRSLPPARRASPPRRARTTLARTARLALGCLGSVGASALVAGASHAEPRHAIAMHGEPALASGFAHLPYVDPTAPKGGRLVLGVNGSFDSVNPFIVKGTPVAGIRDLVVETLMARGLDEPFTLYGLLAQTIDVPADRASVTFNLNPLARFSDGRPVTADDVLFSFEVLRDRGRPNHRTYYKKVARAERLSEHSVRFMLDGTGDRELPLILGLMPILPRHLTTPDSFERTSLEPLVGSGPYRIARIDPGRAIVYERDPGYWGRDLPVNRGRFNFGDIRYEYFRDNSAMFEALKSGELSLRLEEDPAKWAEGYAIPPVADGRMLKAEVPTGVPAGMTGLVFNTRRAVFTDARVRQALIQLFDFEWINRSLFHGLYKRTSSYFERSMLSSAGRAADARERALLAPWASAVRPEVLEGRVGLPITGGDGRNRDNQRRAFELLQAAGYRLDGGRLVDGKGQQLAFEILAATPIQARIVAGFIADLQRLGAAPTVRVVDSAQYQARLKSYDYDMIQNTWPASLSPGNEQLFRWSSSVARTDGSYNYAGVENPAVDAMIAAMLKADTADDFAASVRALDRVLLSGDYVIPLFHLPAQWLAHWRTLRAPERTPLFGYNLESWWSAEAK